jgi:hypothetical protein
MNKHVLSFGTALVLVLGTLQMAAAAVDQEWLGSIVGDPAGWVVVAADGSADFACLQSAIDSFESTAILVMPGVYKENILLTKDLVIRAYDGPKTTVIDGSRHARWTQGCGSQSVAQSDVIVLNPALNVTIEGLCVSNGRAGIYIQEDDRVTLRNCVFWANTSHGVWIKDSWSYGHKPWVSVYNCISVANGGAGIYVGLIANWGWWCPTLKVLNSILIGNQGNGITLQSAGPSNPSEVVLDFNCYSGNIAGNYGPSIGPGQPISAGANSFTLAPNFVDSAHGDFRLRSNSPCVNHGSQGVAFMDPDGTVNDVGAYGGPGAATFFDNPTDGPMVRCVEVAPGSVPQGGKLTIKAVGSVR